MVERNLDRLAFEQVVHEKRLHELGSHGAVHTVKGRQEGRAPSPGRERACEPRVAREARQRDEDLRRRVGRYPAKAFRDRASEHVAANAKDQGSRERR